eukprot:SAG11_NODE_13605_length_647_cov_1.956204_2_plen_82_part_01
MTIVPNLVLFEWDTYFSSMLAAVTDPWVAKSNIIRMTKSLIYKGFVAGFWNGLCELRPLTKDLVEICLHSLPDHSMRRRRRG